MTNIGGNGEGKPSVFILSVTGQIETAYFPLLPNIYCKSGFIHGGDWVIQGGFEEGVSQMTKPSQALNQQRHFVLNFPLGITYKASNPFGWPQLVLCCYGMDAFGNDVVRGYGAVHVPITPGSHKRRVGMFVPEASSLIQKMSAWIAGRRPEFMDWRLVAQSEGREVTRVRTQGHVDVAFNVVIKDFKRLGYDVSSQTVRTVSEFPLEPATRPQILPPTKKQSKPPALSMPSQDPNEPSSSGLSHIASRPPLIKKADSGFISPGDSDTASEGGRRSALSASHSSFKMSKIDEIHEDDELEDDGDLVQPL